MVKDLDLKLECLALGSLPHKDIKSAMGVVKADFPAIPFWPQLAKLNKSEDMIIQYLEKMPGLVTTEDKVFIDNESDEFFEQLEEIFMDYEEIIADNDSPLLDKYKISEKNSLAFEPFLDLISETKPPFAKGHIVGPFTLATSLNDKNGRCAYYDETLREIIIKLLSLKALWQIKEIKKVSPDITPIMFIDEPSISQLGTSAFITIPTEEVIEILTQVSDLIKDAGALSGIHCCGKCDWSILIKSNVSIINLDGYFYAQSLSLFSEELKPYLNQGGLIAWGIVPTLDKDALEQADINIMMQKFEEAVNYLVKKGLEKSLIVNNSMVSPSCGAGSLSIEQSEKAMNLIQELSLKLKEKYNA